MGIVDLWPLADLSSLEESGSEVLLVPKTQKDLDIAVIVDRIYLDAAKTCILCLMH